MKDLKLDLEPSQVMKQAAVQFTDDYTPPKLYLLPKDWLAARKGWLEGYYACFKEVVTLSELTEGITPELNTEVNEELSNIIETTVERRVGEYSSAVWEVLNNHPTLQVVGGPDGIAAVVGGMFSFYNKYRSEFLQKRETPCGYAIGNGDEFSFTMVIELGLSVDMTWILIGRIMVAVENKPEIESWFVHIPKQ